MESNDTVRVAVRIRPLSDYEIIQDSSQCVTADPNGKQIRGTVDTAYTFDNVFSPDTSQADIYEECVSDLLNAVFEGFNATILAYGQTGSGKTYTMGSSADQIIAEETAGIIPRFIKNLFHMIRQKEEEEPNHTFKVYVQFLEIYGEDIRDLLDQTRTSKVVIRETRNGEVFLTGAREELVSSFEQMMKALEDGTRNRTTSSTKMNLTSSRSHAIFTVNLEHTIYSEVVKDGSAEITDTTISAGEAEAKKRLDSEPLNREVRKSKFHFVDLAGSERIKRTGAEGVRLKEGIDINKGLLCLGNVISALGDESKRGKVFVPYRDSKLTRMLKDSLGGNSKTLMICCVSPAAINYNESMNALRYANRARNIKNKPIINRDPTLVMIDQMRSTLKVVCTELLEIRKRKQYVELDNRITDALLEQWVYGGEDGNGSSNNNGGSNTLSFIQQKLDRRALILDNNNTNNNGGVSPTPNNASSSSNNKASSYELKRMRDQIRERDDSILELKRKANDADFEVKRLTELLKFARQQTSEATDQLLLSKSEVDYYRLKWAEAAPHEAKVEYGVDESGDSVPDEAIINELSPVLREKTHFVQVVAKLKREIDDLRKELVNAQQQKHHGDETLLMNLDPADTEFTATISSLIAQTRTQLQEESRKLHFGEENSAQTSNNNTGNSSNDSSSNNNNSGDNSNSSTNASSSSNDNKISDESAAKQENEELEIEREYAKRQRMLNSEVQELGQSILLKEQLLAQLVKSQEQYSRMKTFYETRLQQLSTEMQEKQDEREKLLHELQDIADKNSEAEAIKAREVRLREELRHKDEELKVMKKKQQELRSLAQAQSQYTAQLTKLEHDIVSMKRQRVDLSKQLQLEKKNHLAALTEKAREIDKLKRELAKASAEVKRLGKVNETTEQKMKDALRDSAALKKKATDYARLQEVASATNTRLALKAISTATARQRAGLYGYNATAGNNAHNNSGGKRSLSEDEVRVRKWLQQRVNEISSKEAAVDNLKQQYEQQLELLQRLEELECERNENYTGINNSSTNKNGGRSSSIGFSNSLASRSKDDDEKLSDVLDDRLSALNGQLNAKSQKIMDLRTQITQLGDAPSADKVLEILRKQLQSLPAAHEMVRTLLDLLIAAHKTLKLSKDRVEEFAEKEMTYQQKIDELHKQNASEKRAYDMELTALTKDYEEKYHNLFQHLSVVGDSFTNNNNANYQGALMSLERQHGESQNAHTMRRESSFDPLQMQLAISAEETKFLRQQLDREGLKYSQLQGKFSELEKIKTGLIRDIAEKNNTIRFLEEERSLFKAMAEEMKAALHSMGKDGKLLVQTIKGKAPRASRANGLFHEYLDNSDDSGDDGSPYPHTGRHSRRHNNTNSNNISAFSGDDADESLSVLGEFDSLVEEINRTGNVSDPLSGFIYISNSSNNNSGSGHHATQLTAPMTPNSSNMSNKSNTESIVERLTNPSNFTGSIKTVFKEDLASKRMKTQQIRNQEKQGAHNSKREGFVVAASGVAGTTAGGASSSGMTGTNALQGSSGGSGTNSNVAASGGSNAGYMAATISSYNASSNNNNSSMLLNTTASNYGSANPPATPQATPGSSRDSTRRFFSDAVLAANNNTNNSASGVANAALSGNTASAGYPVTPGPDEVRRSLRMTRTQSMRERDTPKLTAAIAAAQDDASASTAATVGTTGSSADHATDDTAALPSGSNTSNSNISSSGNAPGSATKVNNNSSTTAAAGSNVFARLASQHIASSYTRHVMARAASTNSFNPAGAAATSNTSNTSNSNNANSNTSGNSSTNSSTEDASFLSPTAGRNASPGNPLRLQVTATALPSAAAAVSPSPPLPPSNNNNSIVVNGKVLSVLSTNNNTSNNTASRSSSANSANSPVSATGKRSAGGSLASTSRDSNDK